MAPDGTLYFVTLVFDEKAMEGKQISVGVSKDVGATWKWTLLSKTRFDDRPWVKVAPDGTAHVIWNDGAGVCHAVSQDGGLTWTERDRIHPKGGSSHLAVGPNGEIAVRVMPQSAAGTKYDEGVDLIAVSTDGGTDVAKQEAPGYREWNSGSYFPVPRWVEPLAWDARGALYSFWTNLKGIWLARSVDQGATWTTWQLSGDALKWRISLISLRAAGANWRRPGFQAGRGTWQAPRRPHRRRRGRSASPNGRVPAVQTRQLATNPAHGRKIPKLPIPPANTFPVLFLRKRRPGRRQPHSEQA